MNQQKVKMIRRQVAEMRIEDPKIELREYKRLKKQVIQNPTPQKRASHSGGKRHFIEFSDAFMLRRKKCNATRRQREKKERYANT